MVLPTRKDKRRWSFPWSFKRTRDRISDAGDECQIVRAFSDVVPMCGVSTEALTNLAPSSAADDPKSPSRMAGLRSNKKRITHVDPKKFEKCTTQPRFSGGTAQFLQLKLKEGLERGSRSAHYWIGKDLSHARHERDFYEDVRMSAQQSNQSGVESLTNFMLEYEGTLSAPVTPACSMTSESVEHPQAENEQMEMLVLRNLHDGRSKGFRLLDVKIGQKTASALWKGKSRISALKHYLCDRFSNSSTEGIRLAGFNGPPPSYASRFDAAVVNSRKAQKALASRNTGAEMFGFFFDVHDMPDPGKAGDAALAEFLSPSEKVEVFQHEIAKSLVELAVACRRVTIPQKWVGSSVAIAIDYGDNSLTSRQIPEAALRESVGVHLFDWGRSELNTVQTHAGLPEQEKQDRALFWGYYKDGVDRLSLEALRHYQHAFGNAASWDNKVHATLWDYDSHSKDDFLGEAEISLDEAVLSNGPQTVQLKNGKGTLTYSVEFREYPIDSRLRSAWRICIHCADGLRAADIYSRSSDPYVVLSASSFGKYTYKSCQRTSVVPKSVNPEWNETFEFPLAVQSGEERLAAALDQVAPKLGDLVRDGNLDKLLPPKGCTNKQSEDARLLWSRELDKFIGKECGSDENWAQRSCERGNCTQSPAKVTARDD